MLFLAQQAHDDASGEGEVLRGVIHAYPALAFARIGGRSQSIVLDPFLRGKNQKSTPPTLLTTLPANLYALSDISCHSPATDHLSCQFLRKMAMWFT